MQRKDFYTSLPDLMLAQSVMNFTGKGQVKAQMHQLLQQAWEIKSREPEQAIALSNQCIQLGRQAKDTEGVADATYHRAVFNWYKSAFEEAINDYEAASDLYESVGAYEGFARSQAGIANALIWQGRLQDAIGHLDRAVENYKYLGNDHGLAACYNSYGVLYRRMGAYDKAASWLFKSLEIKEKSLLRDEKSIANSFLNIGNVFEAQEEYEEALGFYNRALEVYSSNKQMHELSTLQSNMGSVYRRLGKIDTAKNFINKALDTKIALKDKKGIVDAYDELGNCYLVEGEIKKALVCFKSALDIGDISEFNNRARVVNSMAKGHIVLKDYKEAILLAEKYIDNPSIGKADLLELHSTLSEAYESLGDLNKALDHLKKVLLVEKSINNEDKLKLRQEAQARYELNKKDLEIERLRMEQSLLTNTNQDLENFARQAVYDMQEPLRMIKGFGDLLQRRFQHALGREGQEFLGNILSAAGDIDKLTKELKDYALIGASSRTKSEVDLEDVLFVVKKNLQSRIEESQATLLFSSMPSVQASFGIMVQLFQHLIGNAIKFRHKERSLIISLQYRETKRHYVVCIKDNGIGIPEDRLTQIFELFDKGGRDRKEYEGAGIGLAICKKIVENLGGYIKVTSKEGKHTEFEFALPKPLSRFHN